MKKTPFENSSEYKQDRNNVLIFGRVTAVFPEKRMVEVKTYGQAGPTNDNHIANCQWLSADAHYEGDESSPIPRVDAYCLLAIIDSTPMILGFFKPLSEAGDASTGKDLEEVNEGDKVFKTVAGNKVILRASGEIQIESTAGCRTTWFPQDDLINELCQNYEFRCDGGTEDWLNIDKKRKYTYLRKEIRDTTTRNNIILEEGGTVDEENLDIIYQKRIGQGDDFGDIMSVVHTTTIKNTGETDILIATADNKVGYKMNIKPAGDVSLDVAGKAKITIASSGDTVIDIGPGKSTVKISASGEIEIIATSKVKVTAPKIELNGAKSGITTAASHQNVIDLISGAPCQPSTTVFSDV